MTIQIYKTRIPIMYPNESCTVELPGSLVTIEQQEGRFVAYSNTAQPNETYQFIFLQTGYEVDLPTEAKYIKTFMLDEGFYVLHIYGVRIV